MDHGKFVGTWLNTAAVSYTFLPWLPLLLFSVKYEQEETVECQETKQLSWEHNICFSNNLFLGYYACFGRITVMYQQHITVKVA